MESEYGIYPSRHLHFLQDFESFRKTGNNALILKLEVWFVQSFA